MCQAGIQLHEQHAGLQRIVLYMHDKEHPLYIGSYYTFYKLHTEISALFREEEM